MIAIWLAGCADAADIHPMEVVDSSGEIEVRKKS
jgi:hypothetical protein